MSSITTVPIGSDGMVDVMLNSIKFLFRTRSSLLVVIFQVWDLTCEVKYTIRAQNIPRGEYPLGNEKTSGAKFESDRSLHLVSEPACSTGKTQGIK